MLWVWVSIMSVYRRRYVGEHTPYAQQHAENNGKENGNYYIRIIFALIY